MSDAPPEPSPKPAPTTPTKARFAEAPKADPVPWEPRRPPAPSWLARALRSHWTFTVVGCALVVLIFHYAKKPLPPLEPAPAPVARRMRMVEQQSPERYRDMIVWEDTITGAICYEARLIDQAPSISCLPFATAPVHYPR